MESAVVHEVGSLGRTVTKAATRPRHLLAAADWFAAILSFGALGLLAHWRDVVGKDQFLVTVGVPTLIILITMVLCMSHGQYSDSRRLSRIRDISTLLRSVVLAAAIVALVTYLSKGFFTGFTSPSRLVVGCTVALFFVFCTGTRLCMHSYQQALFAKGDLLRRVLVVGSGKSSGEFLDFLKARPWLGMDCVGRIDYVADLAQDLQTAGVAEASEFRLSPSLEGLERLHRALVGLRAHEVIVALDPGDSETLAGVTRLLSLAHVPYRVVPSLFEAGLRHASLAGLAELPVIDVDVDPLDRTQQLIKRTLDVTVAGLALLVGWIVYLPIIAALKIDSRGPILYGQERVGRNGRHFKMLKFRSMVIDADQLLEKLRQQDESGSEGQMFKMKNDPRITRVGRFLRKFSLDELPQFINVLRGEMSLVGPRPPLPREVAKYEQEHLTRLRVVPGITGLWQVSGRSQLTFEQMVNLDVYYMENWSIGQDLLILAKTFYVVLAHKGAF